MTIVTKIVDVFNIFVQAANLGLWISIVLQATKAAQLWPVKLLKQRVFASVDILRRKCVRSIMCSQKTKTGIFLQNTTVASAYVFNLDKNDEIVFL